MTGNHLDGEVVAFIYNGSIVSNSLVDFAKNKEYITAWATRKEAQMMAACDFGKVWHDLAKSKTLVIIKEGKLINPTTGKTMAEVNCNE